ncbi:hypothetical protein HYT23_06805 [Candidatus Pacearchaeota archaeon]|nr:hypothetical protein [Candidatus Pacearchaeota archaeon]
MGDLSTSIIQPKKKRHPLRGLAYILIGIGVALHTLEFFGGLYLLNKVESEGEEIVANLQEEGIEIKTSKEAAHYMANKVILEVNQTKEYLLVGGLKLAALAYLSGED